MGSFCLIVEEQVTLQKKLDLNFFYSQLELENGPVLDQPFTRQIV